MQDVARTVEQGLHEEANITLNKVEQSIRDIRRMWTKRDADGKRLLSNATASCYYADVFTQAVEPLNIVEQKEGRFLK